MASMNRDQIEATARSPRSAAIAGLIFSFLLILQMVLVTTIGPETPRFFRRDLLEEWSRIGPFAMGIAPFAGIAFLWFTGVIRDWLGEREDRFFSTVFFGSGIIFIILMFIYAAVIGAMIGTFRLPRALVPDDDVYVFGFSLVNEIVGNYALRMAGVYMLSIGSLLLRTEHAPRWLVTLTFLIATGFLLFAGFIHWARYLFPAWVIVISIYILVVNYRVQDQVPEES
jgi:hypothetical protein